MIKAQPLFHYFSRWRCKLIFLLIWINFLLITNINIQMSVIIKNEMFIKIQLFSFHCCCCLSFLLSILIACLPLYPLLMSCIHFFSSLFRPPTKIIIVIKQSFTHNLSMLNVVGLFFPSDVNYTYSISIFLLLHTY